MMKLLIYSWALMPIPVTPKTNVFSVVVVALIALSAFYFVFAMTHIAGDVPFVLPFNPKMLHQYKKINMLGCILISLVHYVLCPFAGVAAICLMIFRPSHKGK